MDQIRKEREPACPSNPQMTNIFFCTFDMLFKDIILFTGVYTQQYWEVYYYSHFLGEETEAQEA